MTAPVLAAVSAAAVLLLHHLLWRGLQVVVASRNPTDRRWFGRRLDPQHPTGLPLTAMTAASVALAAVFAWMTREVVIEGRFTMVDRAAEAVLAPIRGEWGVAIFLWITAAADTTTLIVVAAAVSGAMWAAGRRTALPALWTTAVGALLTIWMLKHAVARERPEFVTEATAITPAFPSSHAGGAIAVYGFLAYLMARELESLRQRYEVVYWTVVAVAVIGFSRIYLGVHFTSDVIGGFAFGGLWLLAGIAIAESMRWRR